MEEQQRAGAGGGGGGVGGGGFRGAGLVVVGLGVLRGALLIYDFSACVCFGGAVARAWSGVGSRKLRYSDISALTLRIPYAAVGSVAGAFGPRGPAGVRAVRFIVTLGAIDQHPQENRIGSSSSRASK